MQIEVSNGEIVDKLTINQIKLMFIEDEVKRNHLLEEQTVLETAVVSIIDQNHVLYKQLFETNLKLWHIEDTCREYEQQQIFDDKFVQVARSVYITNDERAALKREINIVTESTLLEIKSYQ